MCVCVEGGGGGRYKGKELFEVERLQMVLPSDEGF